MKGARVLSWYILPSQVAFVGFRT